MANFISLTRMTVYFSSGSIRSFIVIVPACLFALLHRMYQEIDLLFTFCFVLTSILFKA